MSRRDREALLTLPVGSRDHTAGAAEAQLTLVEYGDYQCPYCRRAFPIMKEVRRQLGTQLRFVFRNFPLTQIHPQAQHAAEAAEAAAAQGAFWQMHDRLFERQFALDDESLVRYAADLGLDADLFGQELIAGTYAKHVRDDFMSGVRSGVNGTPTFFINEKRHDGDYGLESLLAALRAAEPSVAAS